MSDKNKLEVVDQREVTFYGDELIAVKAADGDVYVAISQMCSALGLTQRSQRRRIQNHEVLAEGYTRGDISTPPSPDGRGGGVQQAGLLRVDLVPLWLAGIELGKAAEEVQPKLKRYQVEAAKVLWDAFKEGRLTADPERQISFEELLKSDTPAVRAYKMAQAIVELARHQVIMESEIVDHGRRLDAIEAQLWDPGRHVTPEQASQISQAVKAIAFAQGKKTGQANYGAVWGEMYRKFEITSYKKLPAVKFRDAMDFLTEWYQNLTDDEVPF